MQVGDQLHIPAASPSMLPLSTEYQARCVIEPN